MNLIEKTRRVVDSCETLEQCVVATQYVKLAIKQMTNRARCIMDSTHDVDVFKSVYDTLVADRTALLRLKDRLDLRKSELCINQYETGV